VATRTFVVFLYSWYIELIASDNSALLDLPMEQVATQTHWKSSDRAFLQHPSSLRNLCSIFALPGSWTSWKVTSSSPQVCDSVTYLGLLRLLNSHSWKVLESKSLMAVYLVLKWTIPNRVSVAQDMLMWCSCHSLVWRDNFLEELWHLVEVEGSLDFG
jgi:hypothetical protein